MSEDDTEKFDELDDLRDLWEGDVGIEQEFDIDPDPEKMEAAEDILIAEVKDGERIVEEKWKEYFPPEDADDLRKLKQLAPRSEKREAELAWSVPGRADESVDRRVTNILERSNLHHADVIVQKRGGWFSATTIYRMNLAGSTPEMAKTLLELHSLSKLICPGNPFFHVSSEREVHHREEENDKQGEDSEEKKDYSLVVVSVVLNIILLGILFDVLVF
jgi:hypothetical protein